MQSLGRYAFLSTIGNANMSAPDPLTQAVILAGGEGTRLRPLTLTTPKPMIPIHGRPFLAYTLELLKSNGIDQIVMLVGYLHERIEEYFGDGKKIGISIRYAYCPVGTDTGTRLQSAYSLLQQTFLLLYGDNYWPLRIDELTHAYTQKNTRALMTVYRNLDHSTKNNVLVDDQGFVVEYDRSRIKKNMNGVDIGFFILDKSILRDLPKENFSFEEVILPKLIAERQLAGFVTDHKYYGLSTPDRIPAIQEYFRSERAINL